MPDANQLRVAIVVDASQLSAGMTQATATVKSASDQMAAALAEISPASVNMANSLKKAGMSAVDASSAMKNLGFSSKETAAALGQVGLALNETGPAADRAAAGVNNARSAMMGLNREIGLGGNRALSTFIAQSETLGPILTSAFTGIAVVGFIQLAQMAGEKLSTLISDTLIFTKAEKDAANQIVKDNKEIETAYNKHIAMLREISLIGLSKEAADRLRLKYAEEDQKYAKNLVDSLTKQVAAETQKLNAIQAQAKAQKESFSYTGPGAAPQIDLGPQVTEQQAVVNSLNDTLGVLQSKLRGTGDAVQEANKKFSTQALKDHEEELKRAAKSNEEFTAKMQTLAKERERLPIQEKALIAESTEFRRKEETKEVEAATKGAEQIAEAERKFQDERLKDAEELSVAKIRSEERAVEEALRLGQISNAQARVLLNKLASDKLAIELKYINDRSKVILERMKTDDGKAYAEDAAAWSKLLSDKQKAEITAAAAIQAINAKAATEGAKVWEQMVHSIQGGMDQMLRGVLQGTQSLKQAFGRLGTDLLVIMAEAWAKMALAFVAKKFVMVAANASAEGLMTGGTAAGTAARGAIEQAHSLAGVFRAAKHAAAKAFEDVPFPFNFVVAPAVFAAVMAFGAGIPSAAGGWVVPGNIPGSGVLTIAHPNEMILPSNLSTGVQNAISRGGFGGGASQGGGGGEIHVHYTATVHAIDRRGMEEALAGHGDTIVKLIKQEQRLFKV